ncbi:MAG: hypothetical protein R8K20_07275 [Gallionellaceae bacterium]
MIYRTVTLCTFLMLAACNPASSEKTPAPTLFEKQIDALDKAKAVNPALLQQTEEQRKAIEQQTQ